MRLPEFDKNCRIEGIKALIFDNQCKYDIILGADFLNMIGLDIKYSTGEMEWYGNTLPMREPWDMDNKEFLHMVDTYHLQEEEETFGEDWLDCYAIEKILDAKYEQVNIKEVINKQNHLNDEQNKIWNNYLTNMINCSMGNWDYIPTKRCTLK